jgi:hypothetical protein
MKVVTVLNCTHCKYCFFYLWDRFMSDGTWEYKKKYSNPTASATVNNMPFYFGHPLPVTTTGNRPEVSTELSKKGIFLLRAAPCDVNVYGLPVAKTVTWAIFKVILQTILFCLSNSQIASLCPTQIEIVKTHPRPLPFQLPPLCVSLSGSNPNAADFLLANGFEEVEIRNGIYFLHNAPTRVLISSLTARDCPARINEKCFTPFRFVNLHAMYTVLDLITWFSFATQAMSFATSYKTDDEREDFDVEKAGQDVYEGISTTRQEDGTEVLDISGEYHPLARILRGLVPSSFLDKYPGGKVDVRNLTGSLAFSSSTDYVVQTPGLLARFVPELADSDGRSVINFIREYMFGNIGKDDQDSVVVFSQLRSAWGVIQGTDFGLELSHLCRSLQIALEAGTALRPIFESDYYEGCLLVAASFSVSWHDRIIKPLGISELAKELTSLATHANTLRSIQTLVTGGQMSDLDITQVTSMVELRVYLLGQSLTESIKRDVIAAASYLRFPARSWVVNAENLKSALLLVKDHSSLKETYPIGPRALFSTDFVEIAMSCFGEKSCPSFFNPNGTPILLDKPLPDPSTRERQNRGKQKGKQQSSSGGWTFTVRRVRFDEAVGDLRKVLSERMARSVSFNVARATGCVTLRGKTFAEIFGLLKDLSSRFDGSAEIQQPIEDTRMVGSAETAGDAPVLSGHRSKRVKL